MSGTFLDDLARSLAVPVPRRRALRLIGGTLAAAVVPGIRPSLTSAAAAATVPCQDVRGRVWTCPLRKYLVCGPTPESPCIDTCVGPGKIPCPSASGFDCCMDITLDGSVACKQGKCQITCKGVEKAGSARLTECGEECCTPQQQCKNNKCVAKCPPGRTPCGTTCCKSGKKCAFQGRQRVCCPSERVVTRTIAGKSTRFCCPAGTRSAHGEQGGRAMYACCPPNDIDCCQEDELTPLVPPRPGDDDLVPLDAYVGRTFCVRGKPKRL